MPEESTTTETVYKEKPIYKRFKVLIWAASIIINGLTLFLSGTLSPEVIAFIATVFGGAIAITTQHTITDTNAAIKDLTIKK